MAKKKRIWAFYNEDGSINEFVWGIGATRAERYQDALARTNWTPAYAEETTWEKRAEWRHHETAPWEKGKGVCRKPQAQLDEERAAREVENPSRGTLIQQQKGLKDEVARLQAKLDRTLERLDALDGGVGE